MQHRGASADPATRRRPWTLVLALAVALALLLLLLRGLPTVEQEPLDTSIPTAVLPPPVTAAEPMPERAPTVRREGPIRIVDLVSGTEPVVRVEVVYSDGLALELNPVEVLDIPEPDEQTLLRYDLLGFAGFEVRAARRVRFEDGAWIVTIPYYARLTVRTQPEVLAVMDPRHRIGIFLRPDRMPAPEPPEPGSFAAIAAATSGREQSFAGQMHRIARRGGIGELTRYPCAAGEIPPLLIPAVGPYVAGLIRITGENGYSPIQLAPGEDSEVFIELRQRPRLRGILLDWNGDPVPNEYVIKTTWLNLDDYDLGPNDNVSMIMTRDDDAERTVYHVTKGQVRTDHEGRFETSTPLGHHYALESNARGSRAFWNTRDSGVLDPSAEEVVLRLEDPSGGGGIEVEVLRWDGRPFSEARLVAGIASDMPFERQWPYISLGADGKARVMGMAPGDLVGISAHHETLQLTAFGPGPMVVPATGKIRIVVPREAFKDAVSDISGDGSGR